MAALARTVERELARIASGQHGIVTRAQLLQVGITRHEITRRLRKGLLIREYRGVYRVGHRAPSTEARYLAAVFACGKGALLSGRAAAHLLGLVKGAAPPPEVTTPTERRIDGIRTRRSPQICRRDRSVFRGIPVTSVARILVDLAALLAPGALARAVHEAEIGHRTTPDEVEALLARCPNVPGAGELRRVLRGDTPVTLSALERRFLALLSENRLPLPQTNRRVGGHRVDCRWPERHLTVELDSYRYHHSRHAWEQDRRREREARARGDEFRRYTYGDVVESPRLMLRELSELLPRPRTRRVAATTRTAASVGNPPASPPTPPGARAASGRGTSNWSRAPRRRGRS